MSNGCRAFRFGDIVLVDIPGHGPHPAMIFRGPDPSGAIYVVGISSTFDPLEKRLTIDMPWAPEGHPETGLWLECRMKCWWFVGFNVADVIRRIGTAPPDIADKALEYICTAVAEREKRLANQTSR